MLTSSHMAARLAAAGQLLVRSGIEIDRILGSMVEDAATISANLPSAGLFLSRLLCVDPVRQRIRVSCSEQKHANSALLGARSIVLRCNHRGARYAFSATRPRQASHGSEPAIELALPTQLLALQPGRAAQPMQVPLLPQLDCQLRMGILAFDATLVDVSLDGRAFLLHDDVIPLCAGTHVTGARIRRPGRPPLLADFEVRHVIPAVLPDGRRATRIGCLLRASDAVLEELLRLFIIEPS